MADLPPPRTHDEIMLEQMQGRVTRGRLADAKRKRLMVKLAEDGMSQRELADRLTRASKQNGGGVVTENQVHKILKRVRSNGHG